MQKKFRQKKIHSMNYGRKTSRFTGWGQLDLKYLFKAIDK